MRLYASLAAVVSFSSPLLAQVSETVVRDFIGTSTASNAPFIHNLPSLPHQRDARAGWSAGGAAPVPGNGQYLCSMSLVFSYGNAAGQANMGNLSLLKYRLRVFEAPPPGSFFTSPALIDRGDLGPPVNGGWQTPFDISIVGSDVYNRLLVQIDVRNAAFKLQTGHNYLFLLLPETGEAVPSIFTGLCLSKGGTGQVGTGSDWYQDELDPGAPKLLTDPTLGLAPGANFFAYKITTYVPHSADLDKDGDVDQDDLPLFDACMTGPEVPIQNPAQCNASDFDHDSDVDQSDFGLFQRCLDGPGVTPPQNCMG